MRHHRLSVVPTSTAWPTAWRGQAARASRPALADALLTMLVALGEDARLVGLIFRDVVVLFDSIHRDEAGGVFGMPSRFLGH